MDNYSETTKLLKSIAHPIRLKIISHLSQHKELSVNALKSKVEIEQSNLSHHLAIMKQRNILKARKDGTYYYYYLARQEIMELLDCINKI